jgi:hypothetical protein
LADLFARKGAVDLARLVDLDDDQLVLGRLPGEDQEVTEVEVVRRLWLGRTASATPSSRPYSTATASVGAAIR